MAHVIAVAGKGGVGKTSLCGLLIQYLGQKGKGPILAVDADANSNLNEVLGVEVETTLGEVREEIERSEMDDNTPIPAGMSKADYAEIRFNNALIEDDDFDLLVMGRTQGKGCYCYVNGLLSSQLAKYQSHYPYMVVDNEAGMEHISRGVLPSMQTAILVSDCSRRGVQAVGRIAELIKECDMHPSQVGLIINRTGSVILEPLLKSTKLIPFNDNYTLFNQKKKEYSIMSTLSREYALSRTGVVLFLSLLILSAVEGKCSLVAICAVITGIYFLSCRKHAGKIVELMQNG